MSKVQTDQQTGTLRCNLCGGRSQSRGTYTVLAKYDAEFCQCLECGYSFLNNPGWLAEAYASAITKVDIGPLDRCIETSRSIKILFDFFHDKDGLGLDYGAGYGLLTRRMRDLGYKFLWNDAFCENLFAKNFEGNLTGTEKYEMITAFEVLEHLVEPKAELDMILSSCESFVFSTLLVPDPLPAFDQWWYYAPEHGQHVSFYSKLSLEKLAAKHGKHLVTNGSTVHMITNKKISSSMFSFLIKRRVAAVYAGIKPRASLLQADFDAGRRRALSQMHSEMLLNKH